MGDLDKGAKMSYTQITHDERYYISTYRRQGFSQRMIARLLGRSPSTISREFKRNVNRHGTYRPSKAIEKTSGRRSRSRKKPQFKEIHFKPVIKLLKRNWSPKQISNSLRMSNTLNISHETIYKHIWADKRNDGQLYIHLRQSSKQRRKRRNSYDSRGVLHGKRPIEQRPIGAKNRSRIGHFEIDTVHGRGSNHCIMTLVDRKTGYLIIGKLKNKTTAELNKRLLGVIKKQNGRIKSITSDNGTEFHGYKEIEEKAGVKFYFAKPYHSWERGTNENTNGLIRQYLPKIKSMAKITQQICNAISKKLNTRPRERYGYITPETLYENNH